MSEAVRISQTEFHGTAEKALFAVFQDFEIDQQPFREGVIERLIIHDDSFFLDKAQFEAVSRAAEQVGDDYMFYTILRAIPGPEQLTWRLPLYRYGEYAEADARLAGQTRLGLPLDRVLYSPAGKWGILFPELFALVGGSSEFVARFKQEYGDWSRDLATFLTTVRELAKAGRADTSWVQPLLDHVYRGDAPIFMEAP